MRKFKNGERVLIVETGKIGIVQKFNKRFGEYEVEMSHNYTIHLFKESELQSWEKNN